MFQDIRLALEDLDRPQGFISSVLKSIKKNTHSSQWKAYKQYCLDASVHPWVSRFKSSISYEQARDQLMGFLDHLKPISKSFGSFPNHKSAVCWAFRVVLAIDLGKGTLIKAWMAGWKIEMPARPRFAYDCEGWDVGAIVEYWSAQPDDDQLSQAELGLKSVSLFGVAMYPRPSDLARLARDNFERLHQAVRFNYFGTKELRSVPVFTRKQGLSFEATRRVCVARTIEDYIDRTSDPQVYLHDDAVYPFKHVFMSQVVEKRNRPYKGKFFPVGPSTCSRWIRTVMDRIGVHPRFKGGSIRMAAASAAIDRGMPIDVVLGTGRWSSWQVFNNFYNRSQLNAVAPPVGRTSLA